MQLEIKTTEGFSKKEFTSTWLPITVCHAPASKISHEPLENVSKIVQKIVRFHDYP